MGIFSWLYRRNVVVNKLEAEVFAKYPGIESNIRGKHGAITLYGKKRILEEWDDTLKRMTLTPEEVGLSKVYKLVGEKFGVSEATVAKLVKRRKAAQNSTKMGVAPVKSKRKSASKKVGKKVGNKKVSSKVTNTKRKYVYAGEHHMKGHNEEMRYKNRLAQQSKLINILDRLDKNLDAAEIKAVKNRLKEVRAEISAFKNATPAVAKASRLPI